MAGLGDLDGDGVEDLAVGSPQNTGAGGNLAHRGAVWILFLNADGTVKGQQKISDDAGGFSGVLDDGDRFGTSVAALGDLDGDGVGDLAVGAARDDDGGPDRGAVWILLLNANGTVKAEQKISSTQGGFAGILGDDYRFGSSAAGLGDLDGDGVEDVAIGAASDDDGSAGPCDQPGTCNRGAVWILFLNTNGTVKAHQKISDIAGGFTGALEDGDQFGQSVASGDCHGDGTCDLFVGAHRDDDGGTDRGAVWVLRLNADGTVANHDKINGASLGGGLDNFDLFGFAACALGDIDGNGFTDLAVSAPGDDDGASSMGAVWVLFLGGVPSSPADITGPLGPGFPDGCVDAFDLGAMLGAWCSGVNDPNPPSPPCENCTPANLAVADISGAANLPDGCVDAFDLAKLLAEWCSVAGGNPCGTCGP